MNETKYPHFWPSRMGLAESQRHMLKDEVNSDVTFIVGKEEKPIKAHKCVLESRSHLFCAMLNGDKVDCSAIKISDIEPSSFDVLLSYLYYNEVDITEETVTGVLFAARKLNVQELEEEIKPWLEKNIRIETVCSFLENAKRFQFENLRNQCLRFIFENCSSVFQSSSALDLSRKTLTDIISSECLCVEELEIFHLLVRWAVNQCEKKCLMKSDENLRKEIGEAIYLVRFQFMDLDIFVQDVCRRQILTPEDKQLLQQIIVGNEKKETTKFNFGERGGGIVFTAFRSFYPVPNWYYNGLEDCIVFTVSRNIRLHGLLMWGGIYVPYKYTIEGKLLENSNKVAEIPYQVIQNDRTDGVFSVKFRKSKILNRDKRYCVCVKLQGPISFKGFSYRNTFLEQGVLFQFYTCFGINNGTTVDDGQIPGLLFSL